MSLSFYYSPFLWATWAPETSVHPSAGWLLWWEQSARVVSVSTKQTIELAEKLTLFFVRQLRSLTTTAAMFRSFTFTQILKMRYTLTRACHCCLSCTQQVQAFWAVKWHLCKTIVKSAPSRFFLFHLFVPLLSFSQFTTSNFFFVSRLFHKNYSVSLINSTAAHIQCDTIQSSKEKKIHAAWKKPQEAVEFNFSTCWTRFWHSLSLFSDTSSFSSSDWFSHLDRCTSHAELRWKMHLTFVIATLHTDFLESEHHQFSLIKLGRTADNSESQ